MVLVAATLKEGQLYDGELSMGMRLQALKTNNDNDCTVG